MKLTVTRLYGGCTFNRSGRLEDPAEYMIRQMSFDLSADEVMNEEDIDEVIRQLQELKVEIAGGCTKIAIQPIAFLNQTEGDSRISGR